MQQTTSVKSTEAMDNITWLALNAYHEARGESDEGVKAVNHVVLNRCELRNMSVREVVLQPWQFSWANKGARPAITDYPALERCLRLAAETLAERLHGFTLHGADHYYAEYIAQPSWAGKMKRICKIGRHIFFKA